MMNCKYHKEAEAKYICDKCKQPICEECSVDVNGNKICSRCIQDSLYKDNVQYHRGGIFEGMLFFCFAVVPGAAQMYMNLFKRGFQLMFGFIASIVLFSYVSTESMIPLIIIPTWFFSFFDSYAIRRRIRRGEHVEDETVIDYNIFVEHKRLVGVITLVLGILGIINAFEYSTLRRLVGGELYWGIKRSIVPIVLILSGIYVLKRSKNTEDEDDIEMDIEE